MKRKLIAVLLTLCMVVSILPVAAMAEEATFAATGALTFDTDSKVNGTITIVPTGTTFVASPTAAAFGVTIGDKEVTASNVKVENSNAVLTFTDVTVTGVAAETVTVTVKNEAVEAELTGAVTATGTVNATAVYSVGGKVLPGTTGAPVTGITVTLKSGDDVKGTATTAAEGAYTINNKVPAGDYKLVIAAATDTYDAVNQDVTVGAANKTDANITLTKTTTPDPTPGTYAVSGTVAPGTTGLNATTGMGGIEVVLYQKAAEGATYTPTTYNATTAANGAYSIANVPAGTYKAVVAAVAGKCAASESADIEVAAAVSNANFALIGYAKITAGAEAAEAANTYNVAVVNKKDATGTALTVACGDDVEITSNAANNEFVTVTVATKTVTITPKKAGTTTVTLTVPAKAGEYAATTITLNVTVTDAKLNLTVAEAQATDDGGSDILGVSDLTAVQTGIVVAPDYATNKISVAGTSKWATWTGFSSVEAEQKGNYVALKLTSVDDVPSGTIAAGADSTVIKIGTGADQKALDARGVFVVRVNTEGNTSIPVVVDDGTVSTTYTLDLSKLTLQAVSTDASLTASADNATAVVTAGSDNTTIAGADKIALNFTSGGATLSTVPVTLTKAETAVAKYVVLAANAAKPVAADYATTYSTTATVDLSSGAIMYVQVTAQDESVKYYEITATETAIVLDTPAAPETTVDKVPSGEQSTVTDNTAIADPALKSAALDTVVSAGISDEAAKAALDDKSIDSTNVYIRVVPYLEVEATDYDALNQTYTVDITPKAKVYAANDDTDPLSADNSVVMRTVDVQPAGEILVDIGIPTTIAANGDLVKITHRGTSCVKNVASNKVSVTVSGFSAFEVQNLSKLTLDSLTVSEGTLTPAFNADTNRYTLEVGHDITSVDFTVGHPEGVTVTIACSEGTVSGNTVFLAEGVNTVTITLSDGASNNVDDAFYTVRVNRAEETVTPPTPDDNTGTGGTSKPSQNPDAGEEAPVTLPTQFNDVPNGAYYTDAVIWAIQNGITTGTSATTFSPNGDCNRAQMVTFLWRAAGSPKAESTDNPFTDLDSSAYYYDAVLWAVEKGITNGTSETTFSPDDIVNRAQTVTFLYRYSNTPEASGNGFTDVVAGSYYESAVDWAVANGITNGTSTTTFSPDATCVRAQTVTFLYRLLVK